MMAQILYALLALVLLGALLLILGLRGKKLNDHPVCRGCGFDLEGVLPAGVTCPECGAGLKRPKAVRQGARRKRWVVAAIGLILILLPVLAFVGVGGAILSGSDINKYKPFALLMLESRLAGPTLEQAAAKEILDRLQNNTLDADQIKAAVAEAMAIQADLKRRWFNEWGDIIEQANLQGKLTKDEYQLFMDQSAVLDCKVRPTVEKGENVPVVIKLKEARAGTSSKFMVSIMLDEAKIGGKAASRARASSSVFSGWPFVSPGADTRTMPLGSVFVAGNNSAAMLGGFESSASAMLEPDKELEAGAHRVELRLRRVAQDVGSMRAGNVAFDWSSPKGAPVSAGVETTIVGTDEPTVRLLPESSEATNRLENVLTPSQAMMFSANFAGFGGQSSQQTMQLIFGIGGAGTPFAFDIFVESGDDEIHLGEITSGEAATEELGFGGYGMGTTGNQRFIMTQVSKALPDTIDLVFKPQESVARRTIDLKEIYGGTIVVKGVKVQQVGK